LLLRLIIARLTGGMASLICAVSAIEAFRGGTLLGLKMPSGGANSELEGLTVGDWSFLADEDGGRALPPPVERYVDCAFWSVVANEMVLDFEVPTFGRSVRMFDLLLSFTTSFSSSSSPPEDGSAPGDVGICVLDDSWKDDDEGDVLTARVLERSSLASLEFLFSGNTNFAF